MRRKRMHGRRRSPFQHPIAVEHSHDDNKTNIKGFHEGIKDSDKVSTDKPKVEFKDLGRPDALGRYHPDENIIQMHPKYKAQSLLEILKNPTKTKNLAIERGETYRHEKKHHDQFMELGKQKYYDRSNREHMEQLERHMDPFVHSPEHRQLKDHEVHPEVKTAKKYESINPALAEITADRYSDWWNRRGQYVTPGTLEFEAEKSAHKDNSDQSVDHSDPDIIKITKGLNIKKNKQK